MKENCFNSGHRCEKVQEGWSNQDDDWTCIKAVK
jgi:hypothetical protein